MKTVVFRRVFLLLIFLGLKPVSSSAQISEDLLLFVEWMSGSFESSIDETSEVEKMCTTRIWDNKANGAWMYSEIQGSEAGVIISHSVYFISEIEDGEFSLDKYTLKKTEGHLNTCPNSESFVGLTPFDLYYQDGCTVFFTYDGFQFAGQSNNGTCATNSDKKEYIVTDFHLTVNDLTILDKRYNSEGIQIGATQGEQRIFSRN